MKERSMEKDREDFEKWKKEHSMNLEITIRDSNGDYQYIETRRDWYVWQNAIATRQPEIDALKAEIERLEKYTEWVRHLESSGIASLESFTKSAPTPPVQANIAQVLPLQDQPEVAVTTTAQEGEPVTYVRRMINTQIIDSTGCKVAWEDLPDGAPLYTRPDDGGIRKAAEAAIEALEWYHQDQLAENLRAALEGK